MYPHPGKFEGGLALVEHLYSMSLDGCEETVSMEDGGDSATLLRSPIDFQSYYGTLPEGMTVAEHDYLMSLAGVILHESTQGFVSAYYYADSTELDSTWEDYCDAYAPVEDN